MEHGIRLSEIVEKMDLKNLTPEVDMIEKEVFIPDVNRPALQLAGFFDHFDSNRVFSNSPPSMHLKWLENQSQCYLPTLSYETLSVFEGFVQSSDRLRKYPGLEVLSFPD